MIYFSHNIEALKIDIGYIHNVYSNTVDLINILFLLTTTHMLVKMDILAILN